MNEAPKNTFMHNQTEYYELTELANEFAKPEMHLKNLIEKPNRFSEFSILTDDLFFDFSRQRLNDKVIACLHSMAEKANVLSTFGEMVNGEVVNTTEKRAAFHTGCRQPERNRVNIGSIDAVEEINRVKVQVKGFTDKIHSGALKGSTGKTIDTVVVVGIGGSYLGCEFVYQALKTVSKPRLPVYFLSNVDIDNFGTLIRDINPETCLWIIVSKSYTTRETMANLAQVKSFFKAHSLYSKDHLVTITAKGSPGDDMSAQTLDSFHMFDFIGGRYSVTSAVGGLPLSLAFGYDKFEEFLNGCSIMDKHAATAPVCKNIPLTAALISLWNTSFLKYTAQAIVPYSSALSKLAPHVQQLYMESLGKMVSKNGEFLPDPHGSIIFGEPGTNAQHSFFQLAHQGPAFPVEFIAAVNPGYHGESALLDGVSNHQELWANLMAQTLALAIGKEDDSPEKFFPGNRPSSVLVINDLSAKSIGILLAFYEARTVMEGFIAGVNPFDQFGVELGKKLASGIRNHIYNKNKNSDYNFERTNDAIAFYLNCLFSKKIV